jgi:hypothetical protein
MKTKSTLKEESYNLYKKLTELCAEAIKESECYERLNKIREKAMKRDSRRHKKELREGVTITNKIGRPKKENKKVQLGIKLPPYLIAWLKRQPESNAELIEKALVEYFQIPEGLKDTPPTTG